MRVCLSYAALPERMEGQVDQYFDDMSDLVGKQMRRAMSTGVPIPRTSIGEPNVISSGEILENRIGLGKCRRQVGCQGSQRCARLVN